MAILSLADELFQDCLRQMTSDSPTGAKRTRSLPGAADMSTLFIWNVVIAGVMHIGCGLIAHALWEKFSRLEDTIRKLRKPQESPSETAIHDASVNARKCMEQVEQEFMQSQVKPEPNRIAEAKEKIKQLFIDTGWTGATADEQADEVTRSLLARLESRIGMKSV